MTSDGRLGEGLMSGDGRLIGGWMNAWRGLCIVLAGGGSQLIDNRRHYSLHEGGISSNIVCVKWRMERRS